MAASRRMRVGIQLLFVAAGLVLGAAATAGLLNGSAAPIVAVASGLGVAALTWIVLRLLRPQPARRREVRR